MPADATSIAGLLLGRRGSLRGPDARLRESQLTLHLTQGLTRRLGLRLGPLIESAEQRQQALTALHRARRLRGVLLPSAGTRSSIHEAQWRRIISSVNTWSSGVGSKSSAGTACPALAPRPRVRRPPRRSAWRSCTLQSTRRTASRDTGGTAREAFRAPGRVHLGHQHARVEDQPSEDGIVPRGVFAVAGLEPAHVGVGHGATDIVLDVTDMLFAVNGRQRQ